MKRSPPPPASERSASEALRCPVELTLQVIGGKWKPSILWELRPGRRRFSALLASIPGITHQVLTRQLRQLQRDGIVTRTVREGRERHVEYAYSDVGRSLRPSLDALARWGKVSHGAAASRRPS